MLAISEWNYNYTERWIPCRHGVTYFITNSAHPNSPMCHHKLILIEINYIRVLTLKINLFPRMPGGTLSKKSNKKNFSHFLLSNGILLTKSNKLTFFYGFFNRIHLTKCNKKNAHIWRASHPYKIQQEKCSDFFMPPPTEFTSQNPTFLVGLCEVNSVEEGMKKCEHFCFSFAHISGASHPYKMQQEKC